MHSTSNEGNVFSPKNMVAIAAIIFTLLILVYTISIFSPQAIDWHLTYYPSARAFISGSTPYYEGGHLENPVWVCILLAPFALFPEGISRALFLVASIFAYYKAFQSADIPRKWMMILFISPQVLYGLNMGTIDAFVLASPAMPSVLGFLAALTKPQIGIGYAIFLLVEWVREKNFPSLFLALVLGGGGILISLWLGMPFSGGLISVPWNTSLFPYSLIPGIILLITSLYRRKKEWSLVASPMMAPYLTFHSWVAVFMINRPRYLLFAFSISWAIYIFWHYANL